ncbi:hypothetical protein [Solirubrum puertoriconensis]|uniref:ATP-binding protein n=1 Tax=Solirubrum puertoriconensis TaxID=1751427 RepID=A0A9X0HN83_SOLP1|nr:hypothetical protein [Solirubrum puertoriconensis]KUG09122.1 hypothetical protein ASU33_20100 [Solirubrum puertoriconensis]
MSKASKLWVLALGIGLIFQHACWAQNKDIGQLIANNKGYVSNAYPKSNLIQSFSVMEPGIVLTPVFGGIYMAGWNKWLIKPSVNNKIQSINYCRADSIIQFIALDSTKASLYFVDNVNNETVIKSVATLERGIYDLKAISSGLIWIWGQKSGKWTLWRYASSKLREIYSTNQVIVDVDIINSDNIILATANSIITVGVYRKPVEIINTTSHIDGLALHHDGTLFVSTHQGVVQYLSPESDSDAEVITYGIHGRLKRFKNKLYILWKENNTVLELNI